MYSEELLKKIAICGGFFSLNMFPRFVAKTLSAYIIRNKNIEVLTTRRRQETGFLLKIPDTQLTEYYDFDSKKRFRLLTVKGEKEFQRRVKEYMKTNEINQDVSNQYKKKWYQEIFQNILEDGNFSNYSRYSTTDYKLFVCFTRIFASLEYGISIIPRKQEKEFCKEHNVIEHRQISTGITYGYSYSKERVIVLVSDFMKSEKSLIQILEYYNGNKFEVLIYTFRPAEIFEDKMRSRFFTEWGTCPIMTVINNPFLNKFFGEY